MGHQGSRGFHRKAIGGHVADFHVVFGPIDEGVALVGRRRQRAGSAVVIVALAILKALACDGAAFDRVGLGQDRIGVKREVRHQRAFALHREFYRGVGGDDRSVLSPVLEGVAIGGCGCQRAGAAVGISVGTCDDAAVARVGRSRDLVAVQAEVGHQGSRGFHRKAIGGHVADFHVVFGPIDEGVALVGRRRQRAGSAVVIVALAILKALACDGAAFDRVGLGQDRIGVKREVRHQRAFALHREFYRGVGGDDRSVLSPVLEGVAIGGRRCQRAGAAVGIGVGARDGAALGRVRRSRDLVVVQREVRHQRALALHREFYRGVGRDDCSVLSPVLEGVALVGRRCQRAGRAMVERTHAVDKALARDGTTLGRVGCRRDFIAVQAEVGHQIPRAFHREAEGFIGSDGLAVLAPAREGITPHGIRRQFAKLAIEIDTSTADFTALLRVELNGNFVAVQAEVRHQRTSTRHREFNGGVRCDRLAAFCPASEGVAIVGRGRQGAGRAIVERTHAVDEAFACDGAALGWVGCRRDLIAIQAEVGHQGSRGFHRKAVSGLIADFHVVFGPIDEGVALVGRRRQRAGRAIVIVAFAILKALACDGAALDWVGLGQDRIGVKREVSHQDNRFRYREAVGFIHRDGLAVQAPAREGVAIVGRGRQRAGRTVVEHSNAVDKAFARDAATLVRVGCRRDLVAVQREVRHQRAYTRHLEAVGGVGRDRLAVFGPVLEGVAFSSCGHQRRGGALVVCSCASDGTAFLGICGGCDEICFYKVCYVVSSFAHREGIVGSG